MAYKDLTDDQRAFLKEHLTDLQHQVVQARLDRHTWQRIADTMNLDEATVRGHHKRATRRLANATRKDTNEQTAA